MPPQTLFTRARLVLAREVVEGSLNLEDGTIVSVDSGNTSLPGAVDLEGDYLLPGLVELHTDNFEHHLTPRPKVGWPALPALIQHDAEVAAAGITTVFDALCLGESEFCGPRGRGMREMLNALDQAVTAGMLRADHRVHLRCELPSPYAPALFGPFAGHPLLGLISLMDHTPGQRQWSDIEAARTHFTARNGWNSDVFELQVAEAPRVQKKNAVVNRRFFVEYARSRGIPLASHDDALASHVVDAHHEGVRIAEFPTTFEAAHQARALGLKIVMGAPNVMRGGSHAGNISALALGRQRLLDALSSDYVPGSLLLAAFKLVREAGFTVPEAVATISRSPAIAAGLADRGEILPGKRGDLVQVRLVPSGNSAHPIVRAVWRGGLRIS